MPVSRAVCFLLLIGISVAQSQRVTGRLINTNGVALLGLQMELYAVGGGPYSTVSGVNGYFAFGPVTEVRENPIPSAISISDNYPNPFNPTTRIDVSLPVPGRVKIELFNVAGQRVGQTIERDATAGVNFFDLEMDGLPNGAYFARISVDDKPLASRRLMLLYGSQHLEGGGSQLNSDVPSGQPAYQLGKLAASTRLDSIVVTWPPTGRKSFKGLPILTGDSVNVGNLTLTASYMEGKAQYAGTTIPVSGVTVRIDDQVYTTGPDGNYLLNNLVPGIRTLTATKDGYDQYSRITNISEAGQTKDIDMTSALYTHNLFGNIVSANTAQPLAQVTVTVLNDDGTPSQLATTSDFSGNYQVPTVPQGQRRVEFAKAGCEPFVATIFMSNSDYRFDAQLLQIGGPCPGIPTVTYAGKTYNTVVIGSQCWLKENLDVGTMVQGSAEQTNNDTIEKYCYDNNPANCSTYGGLYQWNEAMQHITTPGARGICPPGWHVPTLEELEALRSAVNADGNALKAVGQGSGDGAGTNTSGFSALLAGYRILVGDFIDLSVLAVFWGSAQDDAAYARYLTLYSNNATIDVSNFYKADGFSVRCLQD